MVETILEFRYQTINPPRRLINSIKSIIRSNGISKAGASWYFATITPIVEFQVPTKYGILKIRLIHAPN